MSNNFRVRDLYAENLNLTNRPFVNGTGVLLSGEIVSQSEATGVSGFLQSQIDTLNNQTGNYTLHSETGAFYAVSNPSGFITGVDLSSYATTGYVTGASGVLQTQITSLNNQTGNYYFNTNPSGYITGISNLIYTTGDQIISGTKTFATEVNISGNVGIGTASTTYKLDVNGTANFVNNVTLLGTANESPNQTLSAGSSSILTKGLADTLYQPIVIFDRLANDASYINDATGTIILSGNLTQGTYEMEAFIRSTVNATNSKISISCTDLTALIAGYRGTYNNGSAPSRIAGMNSYAAGGPWGATSNSQNHERYGTLKINASTATLTISASQNTASGTTTTFSANSYLRFRKII